MGETVSVRNVYQNDREEISLRQILEYFSIAILIFVGVKSNLFTILAFLILCFYFFVASDEKKLEALVFFLAFMNIFKLDPSSTSLFTYLQLIPITKIMFKKHSLQKQPFLISVLLVLYALILTRLNSTSTTSLIRFIVEIVLILAFFGTDIYLSLVPRNLVYFYSLGVLVSSVFGTIKTLMPEMNSYLNTLYVRIDSATIVYRFSGLMENSNYYSIEVSVALSCLLILFIRNKIGVGFYILSIPLIIFGIMSQSKTFIFSLALWALAYFFYVSTHKNIKMILFGVIVGVMALIVFSSVLESFVSLYFTRIFDIFSEKTTVESLTTGRSEIWSFYINELAEDFNKTLYGNGIEANAQIGPAHNIFIQSVYCLGIIGTVLFVSWVFSFRKNDKERKGIIVLVVMLMLRLFAANLLFYQNFYYYLALLFVLLYSNKVDNNIDDGV